MKGKLKVLSLVVMFLVVSVFGIGYVYAKGNDSKVWDVHFNNLDVTEGSVVGTTSFTNNNTSLSFYAPLQLPGDYYEFSIDIVNDGSKDAVIDDYKVASLTSDEKKYADYKVTYEDGTTIKKNDVLKAGEVKKIVVRLDYKKDITKEDLPTENKALNLGLNLNYVEK